MIIFIMRINSCSSGDKQKEKHGADGGACIEAGPTLDFTQEKNYMTNLDKIFRQDSLVYFLPPQQESSMFDHNSNLLESLSI